MVSPQGGSHLIRLCLKSGNYGKNVQCFKKFSPADFSLCFRVSRSMQRRKKTILNWSKDIIIITSRLELWRVVTTFRAQSPTNQELPPKIVQSGFSTSMSRSGPRNCWRQLSYAIKNQLGHTKPPTWGAFERNFLPYICSLWHKGAP